MTFILYVVKHADNLPLNRLAEWRHAIRQDFWDFHTLRQQIDSRQILAHETFR